MLTTHRITRGVTPWRPLVAVIVLLCALANTQIASAGMTESPILEAKLPSHVTILCADDQASWDADLASVGFTPGAQINGFSLIDQQTMHLAPWVCQTLSAAHDLSAHWGDYSLTLTHEWSHLVLRTTVEWEADCWGLFVQRYVLRHYFGFTQNQSQVLYNQAWQYHMSKPPAYQNGACQYETIDRVSPLNP